MQKSTDFSVRRIRPTSPAMRSRGTRMCTPFDARTRKRPLPPVIFWMSSVHTPVQLMTTLARTSAVSPVSTSRIFAPTTRSASVMSETTSVELRTIAPYCAAVRATVIV